MTSTHSRASGRSTAKRHCHTMHLMAQLVAKLDSLRRQHNLHAKARCSAHVHAHVWQVGFPPCGNTARVATKPAEYYGPLFASEDVFLPRNTSLLETNASVLDGLCGRIAHLCAQISSVHVTTNAIPPLVLIYFIDWPDHAHVTCKCHVM